jgi:hypothetical protein
MNAGCTSAADNSLHNLLHSMSLKQSGVFLLIATANFKQADLDLD